MPTPYENLNVRQKLAKARLFFLNEKVRKTGTNYNLEFMYFELKDIVPSAIRICARLGLLAVDNITDPTATLTIYNCDNLEEEGITFSMNYRENENIISKTGKVVTNNLQTLGMSITYIRRYLWMMALDITEPDEVEATLGAEEAEEEPVVEEEQVLPKPKKKRSKPATAEERKEAKQELVAADKNATEEQINELKNLCKELRNLDEQQDDFVQKIAMKTDGFTNIAENACNSLVENLKQMIGAYNVSE